LTYSLLSSPLLSLNLPPHQLPFQFVLLLLLLLLSCVVYWFIYSWTCR